MSLNPADYLWAEEPSGGSPTVIVVGGAAPPTVNYRDDIGLSDSFGLKTSQSDYAGLSDGGFGLKTSQIDDIGLRDGFRITGLGTPQWQSVGLGGVGSGGTSSVICNMPSGVQPGDLLLAFVGTSNVVAVGFVDEFIPSGWYDITSLGFNGTIAALKCRAFWRIADGTEGSQVTFTFNTTAAQATAEIHRITGTATPANMLVASPFAGFSNALVFDGVNRAAGTQGVDMGSTSGLTVQGVGAAAAFCLEAKGQTGVIVSATNYVVAGKFNGGASVGGGQPVLYAAAATNKFAVSVRDNGGVLRTLNGTTTPASSTSYDLAATYDGTTLRLFINGVVENSMALSGVEAPDATTHFLIGRTDDVSQTSNGGYPWKGTIEEVRLSKAARYTANYTPAVAPFTTDANTLGLWHLDSIDTANKTPDSGPNAHPGTVLNSAVINGWATATLAATALTTSPVSPAVTTTVANCMAFRHLNHYHAALSNSHTPPASHVERTDYESTVLATILATTTDTAIQAAAASTGTATHTCSETVATDAVMLTIAIAPGPLDLSG